MLKYMMARAGMNHHGPKIVEPNGYTSHFAVWDYNYTWKLLHCLCKCPCQHNFIKIFVSNRRKLEYFIMEGLTASFCLVSETTSASLKWTSMCGIKNYAYIEYKKKINLIYFF